MTTSKAFRTQRDFAQWLARNHAAKSELWMRLYKVHARSKGIGYREALDESLCWGWIDGVRYSLDDDSFRQRFTPRQKKSIWSAVNITRYKELLAEKRVRPPGAEAFARWGGKKAPYSFESRPRKLSPDFLKRIKANKPAWEFFSNQAPWYQRVITFLIMEGKKPETREKRFVHVMATSAKGRRIEQLVPKSKRK